MVFRKATALSLTEFESLGTATLITRTTNDINQIQMFVMMAFRILIRAPLMILGGVTMALRSSTALSQVVLLSVPALVITVAAVSSVALPLSGTIQRSVDRVNRILREKLTGLRVERAFGTEEYEEQRFDGANRDVEEHKRRRYWWECLLTAVSQNLCSEILQFGIFFLGAFLAIRGDITAGTVLIFVNLCNFVIQPINVVPQYWAGRRAAAGLVEKLARVTEENAGRSGVAIEPVLREAIDLQHVTFGYESGAPVLRDVSLRLEAGKKYALVGASGSGKSTLLNLLMGACDGYEGSIAIDGRELREVDPNSLYDLMSLIGQSVFLFDDTIRRNITMFRDFPEERVDEAVRRSGLDSLIAQRGEDYRCGENGGGLSGGERQRVSIARCLLRGTPVLLLDEATAALDNQTAFAVTDAILHLDGLTRMVVTHRLEAELLEQYDEIFVLRGGEICERGRFGELMERKEYFYSLYNVTNG